MRCQILSKPFSTFLMRNQIWTRYPVTSFLGFATYLSMFFKWNQKYILWTLYLRFEFDVLGCSCPHYWGYVQSQHDQRGSLPCPTTRHASEGRFVPTRFMYADSCHWRKVCATEPLAADISYSIGIVLDIGSCESRVLCIAHGRPILSSFQGTASYFAFFDVIFAAIPVGTNAGIRHLHSALSATWPPAALASSDMRDIFTQAACYHEVNISRSCFSSLISADCDRLDVSWWKSHSITRAI